MSDKGTMDIQRPRDAVKKNGDQLKMEAPLLEGILTLTSREHEVFVELGNGSEIHEIAKRRKRTQVAIYKMLQRMRAKIGVKTSGKLRFEAMRYVLSGYQRETLFVRNSESVSGSCLDGLAE